MVTRKGFASKALHAFNLWTSTTCFIWLGPVARRYVDLGLNCLSLANSHLVHCQCSDSCPEAVSTVMRWHRIQIYFIESAQGLLCSGPQCSESLLMQLLSVMLHTTQAIVSIDTWTAINQLCAASAALLQCQVSGSTSPCLIIVPGPNPLTAGVLLRLLHKQPTFVPQCNGLPLLFTHHKLHSSFTQYLPGPKPFKQILQPSGTR